MAQRQVSPVRNAPERHPGLVYAEADEEAYDDLINAARNPDEEMLHFKVELRAAVTDPSQVPGDSLFEAAGGFASEEEFLRRLWRDLYGDEPVSASEC